MKIEDLRYSTGKLAKEARDLVERAEAENRDLDAAETEHYNKLIDEVASNKIRVERMQRQIELEKESAGAMSAALKPEVDSPVVDARSDSEIAKRAFDRFIKHGGGFNEAERRALQVDSDGAGGFLVPPQEFVNSLIQFVNDQVWIRQLATIHTITTADSLGVPVLANDPADPDWTTELGQGGTDSAMNFSKRELRPHPLAKQIQVSAKLLRASAVDVEAIVLERLGYKFGIAMEKGYMTGSGSNQPLGVFTASTDGIDTSRDVNTGNTATAIGADGLISAKYKLKANYHPRASFLFHRDALAQIMKLKDTNGQYLWATGIGQRGLVAGQPDMLLNVPVYLSEYVPNTFTTGKYVGIIGDFSRYWIVDSLQLQFQRLIELYAATNQIGFIGRVESDGVPVLAEAFSRVTLA